RQKSRAALQLRFASSLPPTPPLHVRYPAGFARLYAYRVRLGVAAQAEFFGRLFSLGRKAGVFCAVSGTAVPVHQPDSTKPVRCLAAVPGNGCAMWFRRVDGMAGRACATS